MKYTLVSVNFSMYPIKPTFPPTPFPISTLRPTRSPTDSPTRKPTLPPSGSPTSSPFTTATLSPSQHPTDSPTTKTTPRPSSMPSIKMTMMPSTSPSAMPSVFTFPRLLQVLYPEDTSQNSFFGARWVSQSEGQHLYLCVHMTCLIISLTNIIILSLSFFQCCRG